MRIIAGQYRSRQLTAPPGQGTRPTSDRLRETLFNVLGLRVEGCRFADLFAGSGAVALEALSRGAAEVLLVERAPAAIAAIRKNIASLQMAAEARVVTQPVARALREALRRGERFAVVFLDPPYEDADGYSDTLQWVGGEGITLLTAEAVVVAEHSRRTPLQDRYGRLQRYRLLEQGDAALSFYRPDVDA